METRTSRWSKKELQVYILLLCANADTVQSEEELALIRSKTDADCFEKIYSEFQNDSEDESFNKIERSIAVHQYSFKELSQLKQEMKEVFFSDHKFMMMEYNLERILNNMLY